MCVRACACVFPCVSVFPCVCDRAPTRICEAKSFDGLVSHAMACEVMLWPGKSCYGLRSRVMAWKVILWPTKSCYGLGSHAVACEVMLWPVKSCYCQESYAMAWRPRASAKSCYGLASPSQLLSRSSACATRSVPEDKGGNVRGTRGGTWEVMCEGTCEDNKGGDVRGAREGTRRARDTLRQRRDFTRRSTTCRGGRSRRRSVRGPRGAVKGLAAEGL